MKLHKFLYIVSFSSLVLLAGCDEGEWLDINQDPNKLIEVPSGDVLIPVAQVNTANMLMGWDMGFAGGIWSQYITQSYNASQFKSLLEYEETDFDLTYENLYSGSLTDLMAIRKVAIEKNQMGNYLLSEALSIYLWQIITDTWGNVPYFEALKGNEQIYSPKFDQGQDIYADLLKRVDALIATDFSEAKITEKYDYIFGGDVKEWVKFAYTLKLKLLLRQSETSGYNNATLLTYITENAGNFLTQSASIKGKIWEDVDGKRHPMVEFEAGGASYFTTNVIANLSFIGYLNKNSDPRINTIFKAPSNGIHQGAFYGDFDSKQDSDSDGTADDKEDYSKMIFASNEDIPLISLWEIEFYLAEIFARAGDNANAKQHYNNGVTASLSAHGIINTAIISSGGYAEWIDGTPEAGIKQIAMQKWVADAKFQHWEAFLERNRTKYPAVNEIDIASNRKDALLNFPFGDFTISVVGRGKMSGKLPCTPLYPNDVITRNSKAPSQKSDLSEKVWWDTKVGK